MHKYQVAEAVSSVQAALDQVKAQAKVTQRALDEAQRNIAALQGILGAQARHKPVHNQFYCKGISTLAVHSASIACSGIFSTAALLTH